MACRNPGGPSVQGHGLPPPQELWSYQSRLSSLLKLAISMCVWLVFVALPIQSLTDPCLGSFSIVHLKEHPGWGPTLRSVPQACDGPASLLSSCQCWPVGGREAMGMAPPATRDPTVLPWFLAARLSSAGISHNLLPHIPSLQSRAALALGLLHNPWGSAPLSGVCMASARAV